MSKLLTHLSEERLKQFIEAVPWYHTINWPNGMQTRGAYDHYEVLETYQLPESLAGKTVLDVGTADGFFAFEFEKRGAKSVDAVDILQYDGTLGFDPSPLHRKNYTEKYQAQGQTYTDFEDVRELLDIPHINNFLVNKDILDSQAQLHDRSIFDLSQTPQQYDFVFCGDLITHLKDPIRAVENLSAVTREQCLITIFDLIEVPQNRNQTAETAVRRLAQTLKVDYLLADPEIQTEYVGTRQSGIFFRFTIDSFTELLKASGFQKVVASPIFPIKNLRTGNPLSHAVYHCYK